MTDDQRKLQNLNTAVSVSELNAESALDRMRRAAQKAIDSALVLGRECREICDSVTGENSHGPLTAKFAALRSE